MEYICIHLRKVIILNIFNLSSDDKVKLYHILISLKVIKDNFINVKWKLNSLKRLIYLSERLIYL